MIELVLDSAFLSGCQPDIVHVPLPDKNLPMRYAALNNEKEQIANENERMPQNHRAPNPTEAESTSD